MDKQELDAKIEEIAKALLSYCSARTSNYFEAEDLAQDKIADEAETLIEAVTKILKNHVPVHLKKLAKDMAYLRLFEDAISAPVSILYDRKYLLPYNGDGILPTTYVILK